jgi:hypothetical protein
MINYIQTCVYTWFMFIYLQGSLKHNRKALPKMPKKENNLCVIEIYVQIVSSSVTKK